MNTNINQSINGLEAAYYAVFNRTLRDRIVELADSYGTDKDSLWTELTPDGAVPCFYSIKQLADHYQIS
jgi:RNAse (barnase) inhibitor barstar